MKKVEGVALIIGGILLLILVAQMRTESRMLSFDGNANDFRTSIVTQKTLTPVEGSDYWVDLKVKNKDADPGRMYVQCSILDREEESWINRLPTNLLQATVQKLSTSSNCENGESNTQTALVRLEADEEKTIRFDFETPDKGRNDGIWCAAFEQCNTNGDTDPHMSSWSWKDVDIRESSSSNDDCDRDSDCRSDEVCSSHNCVREDCNRDSDCRSDEICDDNECVHEECNRDSDCDSDELCDAGTCKTECGRDSECGYDEVCDGGVCVDEEDDGSDGSLTREKCYRTRDCKGSLWGLGSVECKSGYCVDKEVLDIKDPTDSVVKAWAKNHEAIIFIGGVVLLLIGGILVYKPETR